MNIISNNYSKLNVNHTLDQPFIGRSHIVPAIYGRSHIGPVPNIHSIKLMQSLPYIDTILSLIEPDV